MTVLGCNLVWDKTVKQTVDKVPSVVRVYNKNTDVLG